MNWYKQGDNDNFINRLKSILKNHPFTQSIADYYHIPLSEIDTNLEIEVLDLQGKFSEGNGRLIRIDERLLDDNFFKENFHFVIHEFFHWLKRRSEEMFYFNDPEEVQSFVLQMTWEFINGKSKTEVIKTIYPIIEAHFKDSGKSKEIFAEMLDKAIKLYEIYKSGGEFEI
ncbi:MAG: hypothetical protein ACTSSP_09370 [Candidatus Asgardarchaeia archaeon]